MKKPLIQRRGCREAQKNQRGVTLALMAASIVAMLAMAALSIDVASLYTANCEAQRAADAAALAGARWLSISGMTGDPTNNASQWVNACNQAKQIAMEAAIQNSVAGSNLTVANVPTLSVLDRGGNGCGTSGPVALGVNPQVTVVVQVPNIRLFFAPVMRAFFSPGAARTLTVSATATAEAYNPSNGVNFTPSGLQVPVQPRCVKPWIVPNLDPVTSNPFISPTGTINNPGISTAGGGVVGEQFSLVADCGGGATCTLTSNPPGQTGIALQYVPALINGSVVAVPSTAAGNPYQEASAGCDAATQYNCGTPSGAQADLTVNPSGPAGYTSVAVQALINQGVGEDTLSTAVYPYEFEAGAGNPLVSKGAASQGEILSSSNNVVTVPVMDSTNPISTGTTQPNVTILGFLQLFVRNVNTANGRLRVTVLNVAACGTATGSAIGGTTPVPVRLVQ